MSDEAAILRVAETERDHAAKAYADHRRTCRAVICTQCYSLDQHVARTERQVALLAADNAESQAMF